MTTIAQKARMDEREQRLVQAARQLLYEKGFDADIRDILKLAGVGTGTAYRHFPTKEALVRKVVDEVRDTVRQGLRTSGRIEDAREAIAASMQVGFQAAADYGRLPIEYFARTQPSEYDNPEDYAEMSHFFANLIRRGIEQGHFRADVDVDFAVCVWFSIAAPNALSKLMRTRSVSAIADQTTRFFLAGLT